MTDTTARPDSIGNSTGNSGIPCELTIVMPCLNEAETLGTCVEKAVRALRENNIDGEVVIADNGSTDGSQEIATKLGARVVAIPTKGYGSALQGGIAAARGKYVIMGDSDDSYDFLGIAPFMVKLREGYDLVMGNRFKGGIKPGAMPWKHKYIGNPVLTTIGRIFFHSPCSDFHCGLRGFNRDSIINLDLRTTGMEFASEMVVKATLNKLRIAEVPTTLSPDGRSRPPHLRSWRDGWRHLRFLLLYSPRWLFLYPGIILMLLGLVVGLWLMPGPRTVGNIELDVHTMLYAALAILVGFQSITFAFFTKVFAISERLLPEDPKLERVLRNVHLELGLIVGGMLILFGLAGSILAVVRWRELSFGPLQPQQALRLVIPSVTLVALGFQVALSSFFLSVLRLRRK